MQACLSAPVSNELACAKQEVGVAGWGIMSPATSACPSVLQAVKDNLPPRSRVCNSEDLERAAGVSRREAKKLDRFSLLALAAAGKALSSLNMSRGDRAECGVITGNMLGGWSFTEPQLRKLHQTGLAEVSPYLATAWFPAAPQGQITIRFGMRGFSKTITTDRCAGAQAIGVAFSAIRRGRCRVLLAGGVEAPCTSFIETVSPSAWVQEGCLVEAAAYLLLASGISSGLVVAAHETFQSHGATRALGSILAGRLSSFLSSHSVDVSKLFVLLNAPVSRQLHVDLRGCLREALGDIDHTMVFLNTPLGDSLGASSAVGAAIACEMLAADPSQSSALLISCGHQCCDLLWFKNTHT
jgi:hypothetical protein